MFFVAIVIFAHPMVCISCGKTYRPALLIENKKLIKIVGFIGNDLETSVLLFSVSFCIIDKNAFCIANIRFIFGLQFVT